MRIALFIFVWVAWLAAPGANPAGAQAPGPSSATAQAGGSQIVDGVVARIGDDILAESEVRELAAYQQVVEGRAKTRPELIRELADQWIVRGEANTAKYAQPSSEDVDRAFARLVAQFPSADEFKKRCDAAGLREAGVRRMLAQQLYLARFIGYRFRPAAQVDSKQIETYYNDEFAPQLKARGQAVPALEDVEDTIREVLVQREISARATQWLDETRNNLRIEVLPEGDRP